MILTNIEAHERSEWSAQPMNEDFIKQI